MAAKRFRALYNSPRWVSARKAKLNAVGWRCERCHCAAKMEVHHAPPMSKRANDTTFFDTDKLIVLCVKCHRKEHENDNFSPDPERQKWRKYALSNL